MSDNMKAALTRKAALVEPDEEEQECPWRYYRGSKQSGERMGSTGILNLTVMPVRGAHTECLEHLA